MKGFKLFVLATVVAVSGCATIGDAVVKTDKEVARLLDNICLNVSEGGRAARGESINGYTKVATLSLDCEK